MIVRSLRKFSAALIAIFSFAIISSAQTAQLTAHVTETAAVQGVTETKADFSNVKLGNFGQMDERFFRGDQPLQSDYQALKDIGINTVIDLRNDPTDYEKGAVEALGMKYVNIPMSGWKSPKQKDVDTFLALVNNPETGKFYVHCKAGIHRTGVVGAAYRYTKYGWNYDQVYKEMKNYNYSNGWVHGALGSFVKEMGRRQPTSSEKAAEATLTSPMTERRTGEDK